MHNYKPVKGSHEHHHACTDCGANGYETSMTIGGDGYDGRCCGLADVEGVAELQCHIYQLTGADIEIGDYDDAVEPGWYHSASADDPDPDGPHATEKDAFIDALEVWTA